MDNNKIFIQIASYRDPELIPTIKDCISKSKYPENLVFSVCWQNSKQDKWDTLPLHFINDKRIKIINVDYTESKGACWARNKLQQQYDGEQYTLQLDSHHRFIQDWDEEIILMYEGLKSKGVKKPLITSYISSYDPENDPSGRVMVPWLMNFDKFIPEGAIFFLPAAIPNFEKLTEPIPGRFYSAHFAFTQGEFVKEVPHDPNLYFHGEEISIAVRAFTHGYDLFHPHKIIAWHEYTRKNRTKQWDDDETWPIKNDNSHLRNRKLFEMDGLINDIDFGVYGFGDVRTLRDYEKYAGISFSKRSVQDYTKQNNYPPNPVLSDEDFDLSFLKEREISFEVNKLSFDDLTDCSFCAVIVENEFSVSLNRKDITGTELKNKLLNDKETIEFNFKFMSELDPKKWVVWPHSESKGWLTKIEGII
jgi:hypothetical protein